MSDKEEHADEPGSPISPETAEHTSGNNSEVDEPAIPEQADHDLKSADDSEPPQPAPQTAATADPEPSPDVEVLVALNQIMARLDQVADQSQERNRLDQVRQKIIDDLHTENRKLKEGELKSALLPILRNMMELHDNFVKSGQAYRDGRAATPEEVAQEFDGYAEMVLEFMGRYDLVLIQPAPGDKFNPRQEKAVAAAPAAAPEQDRTIARVLRPGFSFMDRVVRPADVEVYKYEMPKATAPAAPPPQPAD